MTTNDDPDFYDDDDDELYVDDWAATGRASDYVESSAPLVDDGIRCAMFRLAYAALIATFAASNIELFCQVNGARSPYSSAVLVEDAEGTLHA
jgi:hypothetical protein